MKIQSVVFLTAVLMLTTLVAESECIGPGTPRKREHQEKVERELKNFPEVKRSKGMERREFDNYNEEKDK